MEGPPHPWTCRAPVFQPSEEEFADFEAFVSSIEPACADFGIAKVVPPASWSRPHAPLPGSFLMSGPTLQTVDASGHGRYHISHRECPRVTFERFERLAAAAIRREGVAGCSEPEAAALFWSGLDKPSLATVMSCPDIDATRFPEPADQAEWNLGVLPDQLRRSAGDARPPQRLPGVTTPALRVGQWRALSPLRTEESNRYALCYHHSGSARQWLASPPRAAHLVELVAAQAFPQRSAACRQFLRHRSSLLAPQTLATNGVPLCSLTQRQGKPTLIYMTLTLTPTLTLTLS